MALNSRVVGVGVRPRPEAPSRPSLTPEFGPSYPPPRPFSGGGGTNPLLRRIIFLVVYLTVGLKALPGCYL